MFHRFPLPAHTIPHGAADCGDPEWCLHDIPSDKPTAFTQEPIVFSQQCAVIHTAEFVEKFGDVQFVCDFETLTCELQAQGLPPEVTESMAIVLRTTPARDLRHLHDMVGGWFGPEPTFVDGLTGWRLAVYVIVDNLESKRLSHIVWHEFSHGVAYFLRVPAAAQPTPKYHNKTLVQAFQRWAACATVICIVLTTLLGIWTLFSLWFLLTMPGIALTMVAFYAAHFPRSALWHLDANERAAERFARKRKHLKVIHLS